MIDSKETELKSTAESGNLIQEGLHFGQIQTIQLNKESNDELFSEDSYEEGPKKFLSKAILEDFLDDQIYPTEEMRVHIEFGRVCEILMSN